MAPLTPKFQETTRGQVIGLLQREARTVDEIASALKLTDNAVRAHITALERDGLVIQRGTRATLTRPAYSYELTDEARRVLSRAYLPVLTNLVAVLSERVSTEELERILSEVGQHLARASSGAGGSIRDRAQLAATVLRELGGVVDVEESEGGILLRGFCCPLAEAVKVHPATCKAAEAMVSEIVQFPVQECCARGDNPRCRFEIVLPVDIGLAVA